MFLGIKVSFQKENPKLSAFVFSSFFFETESSQTPVLCSVGKLRKREK